MTKNKVIRDKVRITLKEDKIRKVRLIWFEYVMMRCLDALVYRCGRLDRDGFGRSRDRLKKL